VSILNSLADLDRKGLNCVQLYKYFHYKGHLCIVTELLGDSVYHQLRRFRQTRRMVSLKTIWAVAKRLLEALAFLRSVQLVHADLKTENVLLSKPGMTLDGDVDVKLIDFGGATWEDDVHSKVIQTRHYRAPEVVLGLKWSYPCDLWSLGCILLELTETRLTFDTHDTAQHLAMIERLCGPVPRRLIRKIPEDLGVVKSLFDRDGTLRWPELAQGRAEEEKVHLVLPLSRVESFMGGRQLKELLTPMLQIDPDKRWTPDRLLDHFWGPNAVSPYRDARPHPDAAPEM
ncbi:kinase-like domain-containing protein, partial [Baffinella frigidus]